MSYKQSLVHAVPAARVLVHVTQAVPVKTHAQQDVPSATHLCKHMQMHLLRSMKYKCCETVQADTSSNTRQKAHNIFPWLLSSKPKVGCFSGYTCTLGSSGS